MDNWEEYNRKNEARSERAAPTVEDAITREFHGPAVTFDKTAARYSGKVPRRFRK